MASKSHRMKRRKKRKRDQAKNRQRSIDMTPEILEQLPRPLRLVAESFETRAKYLEQGEGDPARASEAAIRSARERCREIARIAEPFDAFDLIECVRLNEFPMNPQTYKETEHEGMAAVIELIAAILAGRGQRDGTRTSETDRRERPDEIVDDVAKMAHAVMDDISIATMLRIADESGAEGAIRLGAILREMFVRNLSYEHMVEDTLRSLFELKQSDQSCSA
jgi:hypothetical protein